MTKAELIEALVQAGEDVPVQVALELTSGEVIFYDIDSVGCSGMKEFSSVINIHNPE